MNIRVKSITSLVTVAVLALALVTDAGASSSNIKPRTNKQIQACVAEIGRHADYDGASRVVHRVSELEQRNLVEMEISIETLVFVSNDDISARQYAVSCITGTTGELVKFKIASLRSR